MLLRTLTGHENKVTSACFTRDLQYILTTSFDRTFKLWKMNQSAGDNLEDVAMSEVVPAATQPVDPSGTTQQ